MFSKQEAKSRKKVSLLNSKTAYKAIIACLILIVISLSLVVGYAYASKGLASQTPSIKLQHASLNSSGHLANSKHNTSNSGNKDRDHNGSKSGSKK